MRAKNKIRRHGFGVKLRGNIVAKEDNFPQNHEITEGNKTLLIVINRKAILLIGPNRMEFQKVFTCQETLT